MRLRILAVAGLVTATALVPGVVQARTQGPAEVPCGTSADVDGAGGWWLYWRNCWGDGGRPVAPVWSNGKGNVYVNVRTSNGTNLCKFIPPGQFDSWHIVRAELPPEDTNYTGVVFCLTS
ncbi:hypothetical protein BC739_007136 [Kutzneria viridogrisea]|uniref:Secreted protein n=2 Tax=Kutzneria TaxID=43356 RepID=A0ABR6BSX1_9PSEU|nr:hypothetical protein [Kutzneria albida]AHH94230.1 putative secreted protein [Kutzneria albida DSM 43870]MBA8929903.1 hypothetical protein [Kutzneria viridogrisea]